MGPEFPGSYDRTGLRFALFAGVLVLITVTAGSGVVGGARAMIVPAVLLAIFSALAFVTGRHAVRSAVFDEAGIRAITVGWRRVDFGWIDVVAVERWEWTARRRATYLRLVPPNRGQYLLFSAFGKGFDELSAIAESQTPSAARGKPRWWQQLVFGA